MTRQASCMTSATPTATVRTLTTAVVAFALLAVIGTARAATINGSYTQTADSALSNIDITAVGGLDWRIWNEDSDSWTNPASVYNEKNGGTAIGDLDANGDGGADSYQHGPSITYDYTDGTSPVSETGADSASSSFGVGVFGTLDEIDDAADYLEFTITLPTTDEYTVTLYGAHRRTGSKVTTSLSGATDDVDLLTESAFTSWVYTTTVIADNPGDVLTIQVASNGGSIESDRSGNSFRVGAAAIIPEPASVALLGLGGVLILGRKRR